MQALMKNREFFYVALTLVFFLLRCVTTLLSQPEVVDCPCEATRGVF